MAIDLSKEKRQSAVLSLERYSAENMDEPIGSVAAGALLSFILEEIGPVVYNKGVADAQKRMQNLFSDLESRLAELDIEVSESEFEYWKKYDKQQGTKRRTKS